MECGPEKPLNPCELEIDLFCKGLRLGQGLREKLRGGSRTRAGLGSGLELILPGTPKDIWVNVPVEEPFAAASPYLLLERAAGEWYLLDERSGFTYPVRWNKPPVWYQWKTTRGVPMGRVGVLQGTYLGIYIGPVCRYWREPRENCAFCTTGLNVGTNEVSRKSVQDVVETCRAARECSGITFVHFNSGYQEGRDLRIAAPFVKAVKDALPLLVGVQMAPVKDLAEYDRLIDLGADHFSFCFEFMGAQAFRDLCPGKARTLGQESFFRALEYTSRKLGKGRVSGEIIAGVEPLEDTLRAIDLITDLGAFPTVCIFRPLQGSDMQDWAPPSYREMRAVFEYLILACIRKKIPIGIAPRIEVSLVVQPTDALYLAPRNWTYYRYLFRNALLRHGFALFRRLRGRPLTVPGRESARRQD